MPQAVAKLLSMHWKAWSPRKDLCHQHSLGLKAPLRRFGFTIDAQGFPHLLQVVKALGILPSSVSARYAHRAQVPWSRREKLKALDSQRAWQTAFRMRWAPLAGSHTLVQL